MSASLKKACFLSYRSSLPYSFRANTPDSVTAVCTAVCTVYCRLLYCWNMVYCTLAYCTVVLHCCTALWLTGLFYCTDVLHWCVRHSGAHKLLHICTAQQQIFKESISQNLLSEFSSLCLHLLYLIYLVQGLYAPAKVARYIQCRACRGHMVLQGHHRVQENATAHINLVLAIQGSFNWDLCCVCGSKHIGPESMLLATPSYLSHKSQVHVFLCLSIWLRPPPPPPGFWNGVDGRLLVED